MRSSQNYHSSSSHSSSSSSSSSSFIKFTSLIRLALLVACSQTPLTFLKRFYTLCVEEIALRNTGNVF